LLVGTFAPGNGLKGNVATSNSFVQGMVSGATGIITSIGTNQIRVRNVSLTSKFRGKEAVRFRLGASATSSPIAGNSTGVITSATTPTGTVSYYDTVTASNTYLYVGNTSYINSGPAFSNNRMFTTGTFVRGQTDGYTARIVTINNLKADLINFNTDFSSPLNSRISFAGRFATSTSTRDTNFSQLNINEENKFSTSKYVLSRSIESNTSASSSTMAANKSFEIRSNMVSFSPISSPVIDVQRISAKIVENLINSNTDIGSSEDYVQFGGNAKARYITRKVTLADGQDAEDLKVYLTAYKPISAGVHVYFKVLHREDSDTFAQARWIPMDLATATTVVADTENTESLKEYEYNVPVFSASSGSPYKFGSNTNNSSILEYRNTSKARFVGFKYFAIKVVLTDTASVNPPRFKDLRVIALQR